MTRPAARFRAGLVGAGMISEHHVAAIRGLADVELVGVHDLDLVRAQERAAEWATTAYPSLEALIEAGANVIHVLTPPATHEPIALDALERGCHVLVEKPLAESAEEARRIGREAESRNLVAAVSHSLLYDPQVLGAFEQIREGVLGEVFAVDVVRIQDYYPPYEGGALPPHIRDVSYRWRDVGIHGLYLIQELLGGILEIDAEWESLGGNRDLAVDEWRALVRCENGLGQVHLSWNGWPPESQVVIHGSRGSMRIDLFSMFRSRRATTPLPKAAERVVNAYAESLRPLVEVPVSAWRFVRKRIQPYQGVRNSIADFYSRLASGRPPRVAIEDAAELVDWVEKVAREAEADHAATLGRFPLSTEVDFLVTGASGCLGSAVVRRLLDEGRSVRAFVRQVPDEPIDGLEYAFGSLGDPEAVDRAVRGAEIVIHAGAAMRGGWPEHQCATVVGSENVIDACRRFGARQLVHISSLSVVDWAAASGGAPISESSPLEPRAEERGAYTRAKLQAELAVAAAAGEGLPCVILRPGVIFGGGIPLLGPAIARRAGKRRLILGAGRLTVPLVYIDDVVDAIAAAVERKLVAGEVIQLVDDTQLTQEQILALADAGGPPAMRIPRSALLLVGRLSEYPLARLGRQSPIGAYRLRSALSEARFRSTRAESLLGWRPKVGVREGIRRVLDREESGQGVRRGASK